MSLSAKSALSSCFGENSSHKLNFNKYNPYMLIYLHHLHQPILSLNYNANFMGRIEKQHEITN